MVLWRFPCPGTWTTWTMAGVRHKKVTRRASPAGSVGVTGLPGASVDKDGKWWPPYGWANGVLSSNSEGERLRWVEMNWYWNILEHIGWLMWFDVIQPFRGPICRIRYPYWFRVWSGSWLWPGQLELFMWLAKPIPVGRRWSKDLVCSQQTAPGSAWLVRNTARWLCQVQLRKPVSCHLWTANLYTNMQIVDSCHFLGHRVNFVSHMFLVDMQ